MPDRSFRAFLQAALDTIATGAPAHHRRLARLLQPVSLRLQVEDEDLSLASDGARIRLSTGAPPDATAALRTSRATVLALLDAETSLEAAVLGETIDLIGAVDALLQFHDALMAFLNGAVRCPELDGLLDDYRHGA